jgi:branched-chain amino acid transport system ATP-binding protein
MGVVFIPAGGAVFSDLTVHDNLLAGEYALGRRRSDPSSIDEVFDLFPILSDRRTQQAGLLSGGEQRMLAFGRAMMSRPKVMLMDEPSLGLAPIIVDRIMTSIQAINGRGASVLLAEQNAVAALRIASRGYVMERGKIVRSGDSTELATDPTVSEIFLGLADTEEIVESVTAGGAGEAAPNS